jgi:Spy/CpxP family protein refolding chaperone
MRPISLKWLAAGLVALALPSIAALAAQDPPPAQRQGPGPGGMLGMPGGPMGMPLVYSAPIQEELALTDKQKAQLKKNQANLMERGREMFQSAREEGAGFDEIREAMTGLRREFETATAKVLDKKQKERLAQIELQRDGLIAVGRSEIASKIKLNSAQTKKVRTILGEMSQAVARAMPALPGFGGPGAVPEKGEDALPGNGGFFPPDFPGGGLMPPGAGGNGNLPGANGGAPGAAPPNFDPEAMREAFAKMREVGEKSRADATKKIAEVLTKDQLDAFEKLQGKPFDLAKLAPPDTAKAKGADTKKGDRAKGKTRRSNGNDN